MALTSLLTAVLKSFLKDYIQADSLSLTVAGGEVKLVNLQVRPEALDKVLEDLPFGLRYGVVGGITLSIPGGLTGLVTGRAFSEPVKLVINDVHLLVDRMAQTPVEVERKRAASKQAGLDFDSAAYRQQVLDRIITELERSGAAAGGKAAAAATGGWAAKMEGLMRNLQVEVNNFHLRFEDERSQPDAPFAFGLTFASFSTSGSGATVATATSAAVGPLGVSSAAAAADASSLQHRQARLALLTLYLDPLPLHGSFYAVADGPLRAAAFGAGITTQASAPEHHFLVAPTSPVLQLAYNPGGRVAAAPLLRAALTLSQLRTFLTQRQYHAALFLQKWMAEDAGVQLLRSLRAAHRPTVPPHADPRAWFRFAVSMYTGLVRAKRDPGVPRFLKSRIVGSMRRRRAYIEAYGRQLAAEDAAMRKAAGKAGSGADAGSVVDFDKALDAPTAKVIAQLERELLYEQVLEYRSEARLDYEAGRGEGRAAAAAAAASGGAGSSSSSWWGWMSGGSASPALPPATSASSMEGAAALTPGGPPATPIADRSEALRLRYEEAKRGSAAAVKMELVAELKAASFAVEASHGAPLLTLSFAGGATFTQYKGRAWRARVLMADARAVDGVTEGTAYPAVMVTKRGGAMQLFSAPQRALSAPSALATGGDTPAPSTSASSPREGAVKSPPTSSSGTNR